MHSPPWIAVPRISRASDGRRASGRSPSTRRSIGRWSWSRSWNARANAIRNSHWRVPDMWGIIPAAGKGSRIQPLAFSKELLPLSAHFEDGKRRPRAVSDYLMERLVIGGATRLCCVISPAKSDILEYYGGSAYGTPI